MTERGLRRLFGVNPPENTGDSPRGDVSGTAESGLVLSARVEGPGTDDRRPLVPYQDPEASGTLQQADEPNPPVGVKIYRPGQFQPGPDARRPGRVAAGPGRPKKAVVQAARVAFEERIALLEDIADGKPLSFIRKARVRKISGKVPEGGMPAELVDEALFQARVLVDTYSVTEIAESASIDQRILAIEMLGKMGHVNFPGKEDEGDDLTAARPVYIIAFD